MIIDTHCHLYLPEFNEDKQAVIQRAKDFGITKIYLPNIDSSVFESMFQLENEYPELCFPMMGIHPCSVKEDYKNELQLVQDWLLKKKFPAIGEIGLDFYWDKTFKKEQFEAFEQQMEWALEFSLPIVIHSREAMQATIDVVKPFAQRGLKGIFHCYTGSYESACQILDMNFLLGIGGVITYKNAGLGDVIAKINLEHLVLETDAPYLTPLPFRGKRNEPSYLAYVINKIAEVKQTDAINVKRITTENAEKLFAF